MSIEKSCGALVYRDSDRGLEFLAVQSKASGDWGLPKGHVEKGESEEETAMREVLEETGISIILDPDFRSRVEYILPNGRPKEVVYFIGRALDSAVSIQEEEIRESRWLSYDDMITTLTYDEIKEVLKRAASYLCK